LIYKDIDIFFVMIIINKINRLKKLEHRVKDNSCRTEQRRAAKYILRKYGVIKDN